jgi:hypothetical protein
VIELVAQGNILWYGKKVKDGWKQWAIRSQDSVKTE